MNRKNKYIYKAVIATVILALVLPGSAAFANFGINKNIEDATSTNSLPSNNLNDIDIISDAGSSNNVVNVPVAISPYRYNPQNMSVYDETLGSSDDLDETPDVSDSSVDWWPMDRHDAQNTGYSLGSAPDTNNVQWKSDFRTGDPAIVDGRVFVTSPTGFFYCLDASNGSVIWNCPIDGSMYEHSVPAVVDGKVYFGSYKDVCCLDASNGSVIWKCPTGVGVDSSLTVADGKLYFGSHNRKVCCLNAINGSILWEYETSDRVYTSPAVSEGRVFAGSQDGNIYCINAQNGSPIWNVTMAMWLFASPAVAYGKVYFGFGEARTIYCLNVSDGSIIWSNDDIMGISSCTSPAVADGKVFIGSNDLRCLDAQTGVNIWTYDTRNYISRVSSPAVADGKVFGGSIGKHIYCVDMQTGLLIWKYATGDWVESPSAVADGKLFISLGDFGLYCFGPNRPPNKPSNPNPENESVDVDINTDISWNGGDPDAEDAITYEVYFSTTNPPLKIASTQQNFYDLGSLDYETEYFWKIIARDDSNISTEGPIWSFTTGIETIQPPYQPDSPVPWDDDMGVRINADLRWIGGDPNPGDIVTYDVYFGTSSPPSKIVSNQSATVYNPETMDNETTYYWKIIAWDNHGASTESPIWSFTTEKKPGVDWWPMIQHDLNNTGYSSSLAPNSCNIFWHLPFRAIRLYHIVFDGKIYGSSGDGGFCCLDASDGSYIWRSDNCSRTLTPAIAYGRLFMVSPDDNSFRCLDASDGSLIWEYPIILGSHRSSPAVADGRVFFGANRYIFCLDALDGSFIWKYNADEVIESSPAVANGRVFIGSFDRSLYCLNAQNGLLIWKYTTSGEMILIAPVVVDGQVFFGTIGDSNWINEHIYCLNTSDGSLIWKYATNKLVRNSFAVANGKLFVIIKRVTKLWLAAIDIQNGSLIWAIDIYPINYYSGIVAADGKVFFAAGNGLFCLDESDGSTVWKGWVGEKINSFAIADGKIFAATRSDFFCFSPFQGHDVGATDIDSPVSDLAGVITPEATVKNFGIHDETDVPVNMVITKMFEPYIDEQFFKLFPPSGWTVDEAGEWKQNNGDTAGGEPPEARLHYKDIQGDYAYLQSFSVDTTDSIEMILEFKSIISCYKGGSNCNVLMRSDSSESWSDITPWSNPITKSVPSQNYIIDVSLFIGTGTQIRFEFVGDNDGIMYWSLDDIIFYRRSVSSEYNETITVDLDAGIVMDVVFPDWTPEDLQYGISDLIEYNVIVCTQMTIDEFPGNDQTDELITLEYLHDVGVDEITEPSGPPDLFFDEAWIHFDNGLNTGVGLNLGGTYEGAIRITPDELGEYDHWAITIVKFFHYVRMGSETHSGNIKIYAEGSEVWPGNLISITPYTVTGHGWHEIQLSVPVIDADEDVWVSVEVTHAMGEYPIGVDSGPAVDGKGDWFGYDGGWEELQFWGIDYNWNIWAKVEEVTGWPPGTYPVEAVVKNHGSFNESNFNVNATIYKRTMAGDELFWEDDATVASLIPGEETVVVFDDVTFGDKDVGVFRLEIATELVDDDNVRNDWNIKRFIMGILDVVPPVITLDKQRIGLRTKFTASVTDPLPSSGIDRLEFYLDGVLKVTVVEDTIVTEGVYRWNYTGFGNHTVMAIAYDNAGNSNTNKSSTPYIHSQSSSSSQVIQEGHVNTIPSFSRRML